jgi:hypothetical protein
MQGTRLDHPGLHFILFKLRTAPATLWVARHSAAAEHCRGLVAAGLLALLWRVVPAAAAACCVAWVCTAAQDPSRRKCKVRRAVPPSSSSTLQCTQSTIFSLFVIGPASFGAIWRGIFAANFRGARALQSGLTMFNECQRCLCAKGGLSDAI